jgi:hypothetical protein
VLPYIPHLEAISNDYAGEMYAYEIFKTLPVAEDLLVASHDASSGETSQILARWMEDCVQSHASCPAAMVSSLPKRILKLTPTHFFLQENLSTRARYACLSHCWGPKGPALKLNKETMASLQRGQEIDKLPKTFREAVHVCLNLDIQFLWIDSLCKLSTKITSG